MAVLDMPFSTQAIIPQQTLPAKSYAKTELRELIACDNEKQGFASSNA